MNNNSNNTIIGIINDSPPTMTYNENNKYNKEDTVSNDCENENEDNEFSSDEDEIDYDEEEIEEYHKLNTKLKKKISWSKEMIKKLNFGIDNNMNNDELSKLLGVEKSKVYFSFFFF